VTVINLVFAGVANGSLYALVALGLVLIYKSQDMVNWAHGESLMLGAFTGYLTYVQLKWPYLAAFAAAVASGVFVGYVVERILVRPLAHAPHITLAMLTVGLAIFLRGLARLPFGSDIYAFPPVFGSQPLNFDGLIISPQALINIITALLLSGLLFIVFRFTSLGRQMRATQQNPVGASMVGVNINRIYSLTWIIASAVGAIAGFLAAPLTLLYPDMGAAYLLKGFAAAVVGGFGSAPGAIVGGFTIGIVEMLCGGLISTKILDVSAYMLIILVMFFRPEGIFSQSARKRV
jgi:branched-chain amino acid transport system permease protein